MRVFLFTALVALTGCSGDAPSIEGVDEAIAEINEQLRPKNNLDVPNNQGVTEYRIAITGNSHVAGLGMNVASIIAQLSPEKSVYTETIGQGYLVDSIASSNTNDRLNEGNWSHVILQGQKYSQSRSRYYPTEGAKEWIAKAKEAASTPILFPEHPQKGDTTEAQYVHDIHLGIAESQQTCLAPVGLTWDRVIELVPSLTLHSTDGNHASRIGQYLTALVFAEIITGKRVDSITLSPIEGVSADVQLVIAQAVSDTLHQHKACPFTE